MAAGVAVAVAVTAVAAGDRRNWTVAAVAAVPTIRLPRNAGMAKRSPGARTIAERTLPSGECVGFRVLLYNGDKTKTKKKALSTARFTHANNLARRCGRTF